MIIPYIWIQKTKPQQQRLNNLLENWLYRSQFIILNKHIRQQARLINIQNEYDRLRGDISRYNHGLQPHILTDRKEQLKELSKIMGLNLDDKEYIK